MHTIVIIIAIIIIIGFILSLILDYVIFLFAGGALALLCVLVCGLIYTCVPLIITDQSSKPTEITTPAKYTNQSYYIDNNKRLYIQQNDTTKPFGGDISSKIEYKESAKEPSIEFKTIKSLGDYDDWIPFKYKHNVKTSISKVILPKSALTGNLTKVNVLNQAQSDSSDLALSN